MSRDHILQSRQKQNTTNFNWERMFYESMSHESMRQQVGSAVFHKDWGAFTVFLLISTYALV